MESTTIPSHGAWPSPTANQAVPGQRPPASPTVQPAPFDSRPRAINYAPGNDNRRSFLPPPPASPVYGYDAQTPVAWKQSRTIDWASSRSRSQSFSAPSMASSASSALDYRNDSVESSSGEKPKDIWGGFSQGENNSDCITISAIKAAMMRFGQKPADVFKEVKETGDGLDITMRDGVKVHLSQEELKLAKESANLQGNDPEMIDDACVIYAACAKRAENEDNDGTAKKGFPEALKSIEDGEEGAEGLLRLGLKDYMRSGTAAELRNGAVGIVNRAIELWDGTIGGHSMAVINGIEEQWGKKGDYVSGGEIFILA